MTTMTLNRHHQSDTKPWYKQAWPWILISIPMTAVVMGVIMITLALESDDGLVEDDYYWKGKQINQVLDRDHRASALSIDSIMTLLPAENRIELRVVNFNDGAPDTMTLKFLHSTRSGFDRETKLERVGAEQFAAPLPDLVQGRWNVELSADDWRVMGSLKVPSQRSIRLTADR